jgi:hypothetical protein
MFLKGQPRVCSKLSPVLTAVRWLPKPGDSRRLASIPARRREISICHTPFGPGSGRLCLRALVGDSVTNGHVAACRRKFSV